MKTINLIHLGPGNVGTAFLRQLRENQKKIENQYNIKINLTAVFNSKGKVNIDKQGQNLIKTLDNNQRDELILQTSLPLIFIDTTASNETNLIIEKVLKMGGFVIISNKKPLSSDLKIFKRLFKYKNNLFFETTVGAGLPIIATIKELLETGDEIIEIQGCFSGTLGYIFSLLQKGKNFSQAVIEAKQKGFTEPDPRDDLSGLDVARKALILKRLIGGSTSLNQISLSPLFPKQLEKIPVEEFLKSITTLDKKYNDMIKKSNQKNKTLRFVAQINKKGCQVKLTEVNLTSDIGNLNGPDNIAVIKTKRYYNNPLVIKGPGAGLEVTAGGVFGDLLKVIKIISS